MRAAPPSTAAASLCAAAAGYAAVAPALRRGIAPTAIVPPSCPTEYEATHGGSSARAACPTRRNRWNSATGGDTSRRSARGVCGLRPWYGSPLRCCDRMPSGTHRTEGEWRALVAGLSTEHGKQRPPDDLSVHSRTRTLRRSRRNRPPSTGLLNLVLRERTLRDGNRWT